MIVIAASELSDDFVFTNGKTQDDGSYASVHMRRFVSSRNGKEVTIDY